MKNFRTYASSLLLVAMISIAVKLLAQGEPYEEHLPGNILLTVISILYVLSVWLPRTAPAKMPAPREIHPEILREPLSQYRAESTEQI